MSSLPTPPPARGRPGWPPLRRLGLALGAGALAAALAIVLALALDDPVGAGPRDQAQPGTSTAPAPVSVDQLPPVALVLEQPLPAALAQLSREQQTAQMTQLASGGDPARLVQLGSLLQRRGSEVEAERAYRRALAARPGYLPARAGLAMADAAEGGPAGLARAARTLDGLAAANPRSQLIVFNQAWLEVYRQRAAAAQRHWQRALALDRDSNLGLASAEFLRALGQAP